MPDSVITRCCWYSFRETADILFLDEETISRWVQIYQQHGLDGLKNNPLWGGERGQGKLTDEELASFSTRLETTAQPGTGVGSGWTLKAIRDLIEERFSVCYSRRGLRKTAAPIGVELPARAQTLYSPL
ncbi:MAG TPA: helix-turn-helix domain-containing protein [Blastocatellia bacterium]|nr:helix-turn-helix domain-containing protein [Blastocatellia bacterium]